MLGDTHEAEDVAQDTFIRLWRSAVAGSDARQVSAWIYRTATRLAVDHLRARRRHSPEAPPDGVDHQSPESLILARRALGRVALELSSEELEVAILSRLDGLTQRELAEVLDKSERTVRRILARVDDRLDELIEVAP